MRYRLHFICVVRLCLALNQQRVFSGETLAVLYFYYPHLFRGAPSTTCEKKVFRGEILPVLCFCFQLLYTFLIHLCFVVSQPNRCLTKVLHRASETGRSLPLLPAFSMSDSDETTKDQSPKSSACGRVKVDESS